MSKVSKLEKYSSKLEPTKSNIVVKVNALNSDSSPVAKGRAFVRFMFLSVSLSNIWFRAADAPAKKEKPSKLANPARKLS